MVPAVGRSSPSTILEVVVLPQPDSPTSPSVVPAWIVNEIESTARTTAVDRAMRPRQTGKCFTRPDASRSGPAGLTAAPTGGRPQPAPAHLPRPRRELRRRLDAAPIHHPGAPGRE